MSAAQHTPGPWKVETRTQRGEFVQTSHITTPDGSHLANVGPCNIDANARLIASAPDMLAFAKRVASWQGNEGGMSGCVWSELIRQASEAIARATGTEGEAAK